MKKFDFSAKAWMGEYAFSVAGTIEVPKDTNPYQAVREHILSDSMYDRVEGVRAEHWSK